MPSIRTHLRRCSLYIHPESIGSRRKGMVRLLWQTHDHVRVYLCLWWDGGHITTIRIGDGEAVLMGPVESRTGYLSAHLRWNAKVGVVEVHVHDEVHWSPGVPLTDLFAAQFAAPASFAESPKTWYLTVPFLRIMAAAEARFASTGKWVKDRLAPGVSALPTDRVAAATHLLNLLTNMGCELAAVEAPGARLHDLVDAEVANVALTAGGYEQLGDVVCETPMQVTAFFDLLNRRCLELLPNALVGET